MGEIDEKINEIEDKKTHEVLIDVISKSKKAQDEIMKNEVLQLKCLEEILI
jgi:hypothetical protein